MLKKNTVPKQLYLQVSGTEFSKHKQKFIFVCNEVRLLRNSVCVSFSDVELYDGWSKNYVNDFLFFIFFLFIPCISNIKIPLLKSN